MKTKLYFLSALVLFTFQFAVARPVDKANTFSGNWSSASTWSLGRIPQNGDSIVIPAGYTVWLDLDVVLNNVYLNIGGLLILDGHMSAALDNSSMVKVQNGAMIGALRFSPDEFISIGGVNKYVSKNDVVTSGLAYATNATGASPAGFSLTPASLPVTFTAFQAERSNPGTIAISWNTVNEINNSHFDIERSTDGSSWSTIATVAAGTDQMGDSYSYADENAPATQAWYRIRQVDLDGRDMYSKVVLVGGNANTEATIIANGRTVTIIPENWSGNKLVVRLISINGQVIQQQAFEATSGRIDMAVTSAHSGVYIIQLTDGNQRSQVKKILL